MAVFLLSTTKMTNKQIGDQLSMSCGTVGKLNLGTHPYCQSLKIKFPIRKTRHSIKLTDEEVELIKKELLVKDYSL